MRLTKNEIQDAINRVGFLIGVPSMLHYMAYLGASSAMFSEASYCQTKQGPYGEVILFSPVFFPIIDLNSCHFLRVLFHELSHATGNHARLNRKGVSLHFEIERTERDSFLEELLAERTSQKIMTHYEIYNKETYNSSKSYIDTFLKRLESKGQPLTEIEAYQIEKESDKAFDYIMQNWFNETAAMQKAA